MVGDHTSNIKTMNPKQTQKNARRRFLVKLVVGPSDPENFLPLGVALFHARMSESFSQVDTDGILTRWSHQWDTSSAER